MKKLSAAIITVVLSASGLVSSMSFAVESAERALLIISDLDTHGIEELEPFYSTIENIAIGLPTMPIINDVYGTIRVLRNSAATMANFRSRLLTLAADPTIKAIDAFVMLHGSNEGLAFFERTYSTSEMVNLVTRAGTPAAQAVIDRMKKKLRMVYNTSCFGASHRNEFIQMGFDVAVGSKKVNANAGVEYPSFLTLWTTGNTFANSFAPTNNPVAIAATDGPLVLAGNMFNNFLKHVDSTKVFLGDTLIKINSAAR